MGISSAYQDFSLVLQLSILDNLYLGRELKKGIFLDQKKMVKGAQKCMEKLKLDFDLRTGVGDLDVAGQQMVEIGKAFIEKAFVLILDEPSSSLNEEELVNLFKIIRNLKRHGIGVIYISHRLEEIKEVADRVTILRDGEKIGTLESKDIGENTLIALATGRKKGVKFPELLEKVGGKILEVENLSTRSGLENVSFDLREGEILGIGGLAGSGKSVVGKALFGLEQITCGKMKLFGKEITIVSPMSMLNKDVVYFPADKYKMLLLCRDLKENMTILSLKERFTRKGFVQKQEEERVASIQLEELNIKPPNLSRTIVHFSGGTQKKAIISRGFIKEARIFILDELTQGIDVGVKAEIYKIISDLGKKGVGIIFISSELSEILNLTHRILVMHQFGISKELNSKYATRSKVLRYYFGLK
jgi:ribose transport system ATP-binding protein